MKIRFYRLKETFENKEKGDVFAFYDIGGTYHKLSTPTKAVNHGLFQLVSYSYFGGKDNLEEITDLDELIPLIPHMHKNFLEKYKQSELYQDRIK